MGSDQYIPATRPASADALRRLVLEIFRLNGALLRHGAALTAGRTTRQLRIFVHYQPQFYHFHVHFTRLHNDLGCQVERAHLLQVVTSPLLGRMRSSRG